MATPIPTISDYIDALLLRAWMAHTTTQSGAFDFYVRWNQAFATFEVRRVDHPDVQIAVGGLPGRRILQEIPNSFQTHFLNSLSWDRLKDKVNQFQSEHLAASYLNRKHTEEAVAREKAAESRSVDDTPKPEPDSAGGLLIEAARLIGERGKQRDAEGSERSMKRTVETFNAMTNHGLTEEEGWMFMRYLKDSRSRAGEFNRDDYEDGVAYAALQAESAIKDNH